MAAACRVRVGRRALMLAIACLLAANLGSLRAAEPYSEDAVKAAYLYRFAGYVEWPPEAQSSSTFTIAVLGSGAVAAQLERLLPGHLIKGLPSQVRLIRGMHALGDAQMLYIGPGYPGNVRATIASIETRPILIVTDDERGLDQGGTINFLETDQRVRFEVSLLASARSHLTISSELLSVAARVQGGRLHSEASCPSVNFAGWSDLHCPVKVAAR
jgi:hypothetical protein